MRTESQKLTLAKVAKAAGVSLASVSRYFSDRGSVGEEIRGRIDTALSAMEAWSSSGGLKRRFRQDRVIGIVLPDIQNPFFPAVLKGIESITKTRGYDILLCDSESDPELELKQLSRLWDMRSVGMIYIPDGPGNSDLHAATERYQPIVFVDRVFELDGICSVVTDNSEGAMQATRYLVDLGHRDIVYLTRPLLVSSLRERCEGYRRALRDAGAHGDPRVVTIQSTLSIPPGRDAYLDSAYEAVKGLLRSRERFTAVFAADDVMALGAKKAVEDAGLKVPQDVSIVGYDDIPLSRIADLTTVAQPAYELGRNSAILLIDLIEGRVKPPRHIKLRPSIVIRSTCRRIG